MLSKVNETIIVITLLKKKWLQTLKTVVFKNYVIVIFIHRF